MNERIKILRKTLGLTLEKFGEHVGVTKASISKIENSRNNMSEQMFKSICREFQVNEEWLRNGTGEIFIKTDKERMYDIVNKMLSGDNNSLKNAILAIASLSQEDLQTLKSFMELLQVNE